MAKTIDISGRLTNERPKLKLGEGLEFEVDNRKNTVFEVDQIAESSGTEDSNKMKQVMQLLMGEEVVEKIEGLDLSFEAYQYVFIAAMATATGEDIEVVEARFQKAKQEI